MDDQIPKESAEATPEEENAPAEEEDIFGMSFSRTKAPKRARPA